MKKTLLISILVLFTICGAMASDKIQVMIDYSKGLYMDMNLEEIRKYEVDFDKDRDVYEGRFLEDFASKYKNPFTFVDEIDDSMPSVTVQLNNVKRNGYIRASLILKTQGKETLVKDCKAEGGTFGSFLNLFGDGMQSLGKIAAQTCKKYFSN